MPGNSRNSSRAHALFSSSLQKLSALPQSWGQSSCPRTPRRKEVVSSSWETPLGGTAADYENIVLHHESDPDVATGSYVADHRMIFTFGTG